MSWWVNFRNKAEAFFGHAIEVAMPIAEQALATAGVAALKANTEGKGAHDIALAAVNSLKDQAPALGAKLTLAIAAQAVHQGADQSSTPTPFAANDGASEK